MKLHDGVLIASKEQLQDSCEEKIKQGWKVFDLPAGISDKLGFFNAVRAVLPLDPPLYADSENWDALNDSLWGGLYSLQNPGNIIIWRRFDLFKATFNVEFEIVLGIFNSISSTISDEKYGNGFSSRLIVFLVED
jgi:hypothetical protein